MSDREPVITLESVSFAYTQRLILDEVSCTVRHGDFVGIVGPNGGGKTTFLKLCLGLLSPHSGSVRIFGQRPDQARDRMAYVPQRLQFDRNFPITALEVVLAGCLRQESYFGGYGLKSKQAALGALERVGCQDLAGQAFGSLSGGQAQRVLIARALVAEPELLLLDEPTANVDAEAEARIYELIQGLKGSVTIGMVTHHLPALVETVDYIFTVNNKISVMTPDEICHHYGIGVYHGPLGEGKGGCNELH